MVRSGVITHTHGQSAWYKTLFDHSGRSASEVNRHFEHAIKIETEKMTEQQKDNRRKSKPLKLKEDANYMYTHIRWTTKAHRGWLDCIN